MATQLDLQEQEQLDALKAFWNKHGNAITWLLVLVLGAFAAWNGWNWYQARQGAQAGAMFDELERAVREGSAERAGRVFNDLRERFPRTAFAQQGGLAAAKLQFDKGQADAARASLAWVAENGIEDEVRTIARLRLAGALADAKQFDEALKALDAAKAAGFEGLVADRRGDVLMAQGKAAEARAAYQAAYAALGDKVPYRSLVEAKLSALGVPPGAAAAAGPGAATAAAAAKPATAASAASSGAGQ
jgi:predicted negative regulator of RcsB-dependent stress response